MQEMRIRSLGWADPLEKVMASHSSILAWRIPTDRGVWGPANIHCLNGRKILSERSYSVHIWIRSNVRLLLIFTFRLSRVTLKCVTNTTLCSRVFGQCMFKFQCKKNGVINKESASFSESFCGSDPLESGTNWARCDQGLEYCHLYLFCGTSCNFVSS